MGFGGVAAPQGIRDTPPLQVWVVAETWDGNESPELQGLGREGIPAPQIPDVLGPLPCSPFPWCWSGKGSGRGHFPCVTQGSPQSCLSSWDT